MNILVTLNAHYLKPLQVMLTSLFMNNAHEDFTIYLIHSSIPEKQLQLLEQFVCHQGHSLVIVETDKTLFANAPVVKHYSYEMYYRLLAYRFLPTELDRILYLDPDILVLNPIRPLYEANIDSYLYAAAQHSFINIQEINKFRLNAYEMDAYYNSGVLLMNLAKQRETMDINDIFAYVETYRNRLVLPDQDVLNALYSPQIKNVDERLYNYDARYYRYYKLKSGGRFDIDAVLQQTVILHFCGKKKPWHKNYNGKFHSLYKHYEKQAFLNKSLGF